jgi:hypothetical protein
MSEVIAFCERHSLNSMLDLLRNCGQITPVTEMFALQVLEELVANDPEKVNALHQIRERINPVEIRAKIRGTIKERHAKILEATKKKQEILHNIERLKAELQQLKLAKNHQEEHESQAFEDEIEPLTKICKMSEGPMGGLDDDEETQMFFDGNDTQPKAEMTQAAALMMMNFKRK